MQLQGWGAKTPSQPSASSSCDKWTCLIVLVTHRYKQVFGNTCV